MFRSQAVYQRETRARCKSTKAFPVASELASSWHIPVQFSYAVSSDCYGMTVPKGCLVSTQVRRSTEQVLI